MKLVQRGLAGALCAGAALVAPGVARAADVRAYDCLFKQSQAWEYEAGVFAPQPGGEFAFRVVEVNIPKQTARLTTDQGGTDLKVVSAIDATHLIEVTLAGFLNLTTIYEQPDANGRYPAVHSRHMGIVGQPTGGQYTGFCRKIDGAK